MTRKVHSVDYRPSNMVRTVNRTAGSLQRSLLIFQIWFVG